MKRSKVRTRSLPRKTFGTVFLQAAVAAVVLAAAGLVRAGSYTNSASGNWDADASWTGGKPSAGGASDAVIVFSPAGVDNSVNNLAGSFVLNRMEFASGTVTVSGNAFTFSNNGATGPTVANVSGNAAVIKSLIALGAQTTFNAANAITVNGIISGSGALTKTGSGTLSLATNNTYTGSTTVSEGTLTLVTAATVTSMSSTNITVQSGSTMKVLSGVPNAFSTTDKTVFNVQSNGTLTSDVPTIHCGYLNASSGATVNGAQGCLSLHGTDTVSQVAVTLGSLTFKRLILEPNSAVNPTQTVRFDGTGSGLTIGTTSGAPFSWRPGSSSGLITYNMDIADSPAADVDLSVPFLNLRPGVGGIAFVKQGDGVMKLGSLEWSGGSVYSNTPVSCAVRAGTFVLNTSAANGVGVNFASFSVSGGATLQVGDGGTTGTLYTNVANDGIVTFNRSDAVTYTKVISGSGSITKAGTNTLTLTGANTYSGGTAVSGGLLLVNAPGSLGAGSAALVSGGTLGGNGTVSSPVAVSADGRLAPGGLNTVGTLTLADAGADALTLNGGALLADVSNVAGTCDVVVVSGNLVLNGASTVALSFPNGSVPAGSYTLMTYAAKTGDGTLALSPPYQNSALTVGETSVVLTVSGSGITSLKWKGNLSGTWDTSTENWSRDGVATAFASGDAVVFDDTASGNFTVGSATEVEPFSVTFNNTSNYTLSASVGGTSARLVKSGSGLATLSGANTYGGGTTLSAGTLGISAYENLPTAGGLTFSGGTLLVTGTAVTSLDAYAVNWGSFNGGFNVGASANTLTVPHAIGGSGSLSKSGAGTVALSGTNTYSGGTTVSAGYLRVNNSRALGSGAVSVTGSNCELDLTGGLVVTNAITVRGVGVVNSAGSLQSSGGTSNTWAGPVTLGENQARIGAIGGVLEVSGVIGSGTNKYDLVVRNPNDVGGTLLLSNNNTWQGNTWIRCGTIRLGLSHALPVTSVLQLGLNAAQACTNATFDLAGFDQRIAGLTDVGTDNLHVVTNSAQTLSRLTVSNAMAYTYSGMLSGPLELFKTGEGTQTLAGLGDSARLTVSNGTLAVSGTGSLGANCTNIAVEAGTLSLAHSACVDDGATLRIANGGGAKVSLASGVSEAVGTLFFGDKQRPGGTYGASGSGASVIDNEHFAGAGVLRVLHGNGGTILKIQ